MVRIYTKHWIMILFIYCYTLFNTCIIDIHLSLHINHHIHHVTWDNDHTFRSTKIPDGRASVDVCWTGSIIALLRGRARFVVPAFRTFLFPLDTDCAADGGGCKDCDDGGGGTFWSIAGTVAVCIPSPIIFGIPMTKPGAPSKRHATLSGRYWIW